MVNDKEVLMRIQSITVKEKIFADIMLM